jgi:hypothetical protein
MPVLLFQPAKLAQHAFPAKLVARVLGLLLSGARLITPEGRVPYLQSTSELTMTTNSMIRTMLAAALLSTVAAAGANAQCCPAPTTVFQPVGVTAFQPVAPVVHTGWYPGFWLDRIRARLWGAPATFVAASPVSLPSARSLRRPAGGPRRIAPEPHTPT